ncbi:hypothetical protein [Photobacterium leiognathi]|uniref:hypothetical protein n=1 Tax=Photobacterium leiognathi TaxID=553611 RepID=UPI0034E57030
MPKNTSLIFQISGMATTLIYDRIALRDCVAEGKSVFEWKDAKAKAEISALMEEVFRG